MGEKSRKKIWFWLALLGSFCMIAAVIAGFFLYRYFFQPDEDPRLVSLEQLVSDSETEPEFTMENGFPRYVNVKIPVEGEDSVARARNFFETYKDLYWQSSPDLALEVLKVNGENEEYVTFYQTYKGLMVYGANIVVILDGEYIRATIGALLPADIHVDTSPAISALEAADYAREALGVPDARVVGTTTPMVFEPGLFEDVYRSPTLVWRVALWAGDTWNFYVDAFTGEVLLIQDFSLEGFELDLEDANGNSAANSSCYWTTTDDDWVGDEGGYLVSEKYDKDIVKAWHVSHDAYYYFKNTFSWDSFDNDGTELEVYVHAGIPNASWTSGYGCNLIEFANGWPSYDVMVHEYTHGVVSSTSELGGVGQAGSLNEAFADTMAMGADTSNWYLGEDRVGYMGSPFRNYNAHTIWKMSQYDPNGDRYTNMGIPSIAGYKIATGGYQNAWGGGLGRMTMVHLYWNVMLNMPSSAKFIDLRNMSVTYAQQHWTQQDVCEVMNAFALVELGTGDWECDGIPDPELADEDNDYVVDIHDNCVGLKNILQKDMDQDGVGDACDDDADGDLTIDTNDNCPGLYNPLQEDYDLDGVGNLCDDEDSDTVPDHLDNCKWVANTNQNDMDGDGIGNVCDNDMDGDGINEWDSNHHPLDNCQFLPNADQADADGDGTGDACDKCPNDYDLVTAWTNVPQGLEGQGIYPQPYQPDSDGDGIPDACDSNLQIGTNSWSIHEIDPLGNFHELIVKVEPGRVQPGPLPPCPFDRDGYYSAAEKGRVVLESEGELFGAWVSDDKGKSVGSHTVEKNKITLDFRPQGGKAYFINFVLPEGKDEVKLTMSYICGNDLPDQVTTAPILLPTSTPTWAPTLPSTPTPTSTPTVQIEAAAVTISHVALSDALYRNCEPDEMTFEVVVSEPVFGTMIFTRMEDKSTGAMTDWAGVFTMTPMGGNMFMITLNADEIPDIDAYEEAWMLYQFVVINEKSDVLGRSVTYRDVTVEDCGTQHEPEEGRTPVSITPTRRVTPTSDPAGVP